MIVRDIVERPTAGPSAPRPPQLPKDSSKGFPAPKRRLAGARTQDALQHPLSQTNSTKAGPSRGVDRSAEPGRTGFSEVEKVRQEVGAENAARVTNMTDEEREGEIAELEERFGGGLLEALKKRAMARTSAGPSADDPPDTTTSRPRHAGRSMPPESHELKSKYFPDVPSEPEKLAWMAPLPSSSSDTSSPRFDLSGNRLSATAQQDLPTHLGLHHHGDAPDLAGYTVDEILHLSRSTVVAQRVIMLDVLAKVLTIYAPLGGSKPDEEVWKLVRERKALEEGLMISLDIIKTSKSVNLLRAAVEVVYGALGGESWTTLDETRASDQFVPEPTHDRPRIAALELENLIPRLDELLSSADYLPPRSVHLLLRILHHATLASQDYAEEVCRLIPHLVLSQVGAPSSPTPKPSFEVLRLLRDVIAASRRCAEALNAAGIIDTLLRYLLPSSWQQDAPHNGEATALAVEVLRVLQNFARYGMGSSYAVSALDIFRDLGTAVLEICKANRSALGAGLVEAYFDLLAVWTTCAIDPHKTTPEHDLTWSQVSPVGWADSALEAAMLLVEQGSLGAELRAALGVLSQWLVGIAINEPSRSIQEQAKIRSGLGQADIRQKLLDSLPPFDVDKKPAVDEEVMQTMVGAIRMHNLCPMPTDAGFLLGRPGLLSRLSAMISIPAYRSTSWSRVLGYEIIQASKLQEKIVSRSWSEPRRQIFKALGLMSRFQPGEESMALDLLDDILRADWAVVEPELAKNIGFASGGEGLEILRPLLQYAIMPSLDHLVSPVVPSPQYLKVATTLLRPAPSPSRLGSGLPLSSSWIFSPIDELLRSADSPALAQGPPDWNPSELDIVRETLTLALLARSVAPTTLGAGEMILGGMKVYMLEHATSTKGVSGGEVEVFRDTSVSRLLQRMIEGCKPPSPSAQPVETPIDQTGTIEDIAKSSLHDVPFFQFYTDLLALFEGVSFGDPTFATFLLPPLSMRYPTDFRKLLWVDHPTAIRLIRTPLSKLPIEHMVEEYFEPPEESAEVLRGYARALSRGWAGPSQEALQVIAIHHIASSLWSEGTAPAEELRKSLLVTLFAGSDAVVKKVLRYNTSSRGVEAIAEKELERRKALVKDLLGEKAAERVAGL